MQEKEEETNLEKSEPNRTKGFSIEKIFTQEYMERATVCELIEKMNELGLSNLQTRFFDKATGEVVAGVTLVAGVNSDDYLLMTRQAIMWVDAERKKMMHNSNQLH